MKRFIYYSLVLVVITAITILNLSFTISSGNAACLDEETSLLLLEDEELLCLEDVHDQYYIDDCFYIINDCWQGNKLEFCWQELFIYCPPPEYVYSEMRLKKCKEDDQ